MDAKSILFASPSAAPHGRYPWTRRKFLSQADRRSAGDTSGMWGTMESLYMNPYKRNPVLSRVGL